jgi:predicted transcriptional regulator
VTPAYLIAATAMSAPPLRTARARYPVPRLKWSDPARQAMTDFLRDPPLMLGPHASVEEATDRMFAAGVRSLLVVRDRRVIGLISAAQAARARPLRRHIVDAMTLTEEAPAIDWGTLDEARVLDLLEIFDGSGVDQLLVLESHSATLNSVRGLVQRERLQRQLQSPWSLQSAMM